MYKLLVYSDELYHYGVKGMRWGVRRYQNYDGSRIKGGPVTNPSHSGHPQRIRDTVVGGQGGKAKGSAQLAANASGTKDDDKKKSIAEVLTEPSVRQGKGKDNISPLEDATRDVNKVTDSGKKLTEIGKKYDPKVKEAGDKAEKEAKKMSDKELRDKINRIKMEKEYRSLAESDVESGWDKAHEILEVAGDVVGIIGSLASLYLTYKLAKGKIGHSDVSGAEHELKSFMEANEFDEEVIAHFMDLDDDYVEGFLEHHGVKGMRWGVRRYQNYDGSRISTGTPNLPKPSSLGGGVGSGVGGGGGGRRADSNPVLQKRKQNKAVESFKKSVAGGQGGRAEGNARFAAAAKPKPSKIRADGKDESTFTREEKKISNDARKDAEEFARAKAFYGEGAGNRRKAIKTSVEAKKKKNKFYAEEFEYHLSQQDMEYHMREAKRERNSKDMTNNTRKALNKTNRALGQLSRYL